MRALRLLAADGGDDEGDEEDEDEERRDDDQGEEDEEEDEETVWTSPSASMPVRGMNVIMREVCHDYLRLVWPG